MSCEFKWQKRLSYALIPIVLAIVSCRFTPSALAIVPQIQDAIVWSIDDATILNVTVYHTPDSPPSHFVSFVEVNVSGDIQSFPISKQNGTVFIVQCNLGSIEGTPLATVRAHCSSDGYGIWSDPIQVPEFSLLSLLLTLSAATIVVVVVFRKAKPNSPPQIHQG